MTSTILFLKFYRFSSLLIVLIFESFKNISDIAFSQYQPNSGKKLANSQNRLIFLFLD